MAREIGLIAAGVAVMVLSGCTAAAAPRPTVTVTAPVVKPSLRPGDGAAWDLSALCAAESEIATVANWRQQQSEAHRLSPPESKAVSQAIAVQVLELDHGGSLPESVRPDVATIVAAAGSLAHPSIDLATPTVNRAQTHITQVCQANGLTIGVIAQGG